MYIATTETIGDAIAFDFLLFGHLEELSAPCGGAIRGDARYRFDLVD